MPSQPLDLSQVSTLQNVYTAKSSARSGIMQA